MGINGINLGRMYRDVEKSSGKAYSVDMITE